ncbi:MAG: hypothetical protein QOE97_2310 [Pseudonocardiales bacterium]|nr:hypothetical protein [Pseudonocardiales bacterium]
MDTVIVSYDVEAGATYVELRANTPVTHTVEISDLVAVDVDAHNEPIGIDFAVPPSLITEQMLHRIVDAFPIPVLKGLADDRSWLLTRA